MNYDQAVSSTTEKGTNFIGQAIAKILPSEYGGSVIDQKQIDVLEAWIAREKAVKVEICAFEYEDELEGDSAIFLECYEADTLKFCKESEGDGTCITYYLPSVLVF
jgi:hypothetical protein